MSSTIASPTATQRRTRVRAAVVVFAIVLGMVTYLDRACLGTLKIPIKHDLGLSDYQISYAFTAFALAYGGFGIFSAWWGDRVGTRIMLTAVVLAWSGFTVATGLAQGLVSLVVIQFCFGAAESGAWPAITRTLSRWIPYGERGTAAGVVWIGAHITIGLTPLLVHELSRPDSAGVPFLSWRAIFCIFGVVGLLWAAAWYWWFRDEPSEHRQVNAAELAHIMAGRKPATVAEHTRGWAFWRRLLLNRNVLALCLMYVPNSYIFYFCITWYQTFLNKARGMEGRELAFFTGLPLILSVVADLLGGPTTDWAVRRFGPRWGRAGVGFASYVVAGTAVLLAALARNPWLTAILFGLGTAANIFLLGAAWGTCQDIGGAHAGVVSATMNTAGQVGPMICPILVVYVAEKLGWNANLLLIGLSFLLFSLCWLVINPQKKVFE